MKILIDTCIILDAIFSRKPFDEEAQKVLDCIADQNLKGYVSASSMTDIYYIVRKKLHNEIEARNVLKTIIDCFDIADTTAEDCENAISSEMRDYEDAVLVEMAVRLNMDCIITRNTKDFTDSRMTYYTPADFVVI